MIEITLVIHCCVYIQYIGCNSCFPVISGLDPALLGLALTYAVNLSSFLQYTVRQSAEVENLVSDVIVCSFFLLGMRVDNDNLQCVVMDTLVDGVS